MNGDTQDMGRTTGASSAGAAAPEPGSSDNRMSLDVNSPDFEFTKEWSDGETYTLTEVVVRQESPGEYEILSAKGGGEEEESPPERRGAMAVAADEPDADMGGTQEKKRHRNPAIAKLMAGEKS